MLSCPVNEPAVTQSLPNPAVSKVSIPASANSPLHAPAKASPTAMIRNARMTNADSTKGPWPERDQTPFEKAD